MTYAERLPEIVATYKAELREQERRNWAKWHSFRKRIEATTHPKTTSKKETRHD